MKHIELCYLFLVLGVPETCRNSLRKSALCFAYSQNALDSDVYDTFKTPSPSVVKPYNMMFLLYVAAILAAK